MNAKQKEFMFFASLAVLVFMFVAAVPVSDPPYIMKLTYVVGILSALVMTVLSGLVMLIDELRTR